jgi:hypothetical protein
MDQVWILGYELRARQWDIWSSLLRIAQTSRFLSLEYCKEHYQIWHTLGKGIETSWAILNEENRYSHCLALTPIAKYPDLVHTQGLS